LLFATGLLLLMALVAAGTVCTGQLLRTWTPSFNVMLSLPENALRLVLIGACVGLGYALGPGTAPLGWQTSHAGLDVELGTIVGVLMAGGFAFAGRAVEHWWGPEAFEDKLLRCILPAVPREWPGVLLALLPAAALEELLFRSLPLGGVAALPAGRMLPFFLMWPLALFFGLLHWPQGGWGVAGTTLAGLVLSLLFLATGSIWSALAAHYVLNVLQVVLAQLTGTRPLRGPT